MSNEFKTWTSNNKNPMNQLEFALFIENNLLDINGDKGEDGLPTGAQMMQMALNLEVTQDSRIKSAVRLQSGGIRLEYVNDDDDATQKTMSVFEKFAIGIPVFWNGDCFKIEARLRYKKDGSKINFWYELVRDDKTFEHAALDMIKKIKTDTQLPFFMGTPFHNIKHMLTTQPLR